MNFENQCRSTPNHPFAPIGYPLASIDIAQLEVLILVVEDVEFPVKSMFARPGLFIKRTIPRVSLSRPSRNAAAVY